MAAAQQSHCSLSFSATVFKDFSSTGPSVSSLIAFNCMCMADSRYACACKAKRALTRHLQAISWYSKGTASPGLSAQSDVMGFKIQASLHLVELRTAWGWCTNWQMRTSWMCSTTNQCSELDDQWHQIAYQGSVFAQHNSNCMHDQGSSSSESV